MIERICKEKPAVLGIMENSTTGIKAEYATLGS
jgi:hypothetical protein